MATKYMMGLDLKIKTEKLREVAEALANETRLLMLITLRNNREISHQELAKKIDKSPATISSHMKYLKRAGILEDVSLKGLRGRIKKVPRFLVDEILIKL